MAPGLWKRSSQPILARHLGVNATESKKAWSRGLFALPSGRKLRRRVAHFHLHPKLQRQSQRKERLDEPGRQWKTSEPDYSERDDWGDYIDRL
jgi:hypothetical protein